MRILSYLNVSNFDNIESDSGYVFNRILCDEFSKHGHKFSIILPNELKSKYAFSGEVFYAKLGNTKYESRFSFSWKEIEQIILDFKPDLIFLNQCELTSAIKALLLTNGLANVKILSYCHYPALHLKNKKVVLDSSLNDGNLCSSILYDILTSVNISDFFVIQSKFARNLLISYAKKIKFKLKKKINIIPPPLDNKILEYSFRPIKAKFIAYNHRLYDSYGTQKLFELINQNSDKDFVILNPMANRSKNRQSFNSSPEKNKEKLSTYKNVTLINGGLDKKYYLQNLSQCYIAIGCFREACVWSMSLIDAMVVGMPVIAPKYASYPEFVPAYLLFKSLKGANRLINKLYYETDFYKKALLDCKKNLKNLRPGEIYKKYAKLLNVE